MDWVCMVLDAHFTVLVMTPEAKGLLVNLHSFVKSQVTNTWMLNEKFSGLKRKEKKKKPQNMSILLLFIGEVFTCENWSEKDLKDALLCPQVRLVSELGKIEGSLQELNKMKVKKDVGQYSIEIIELF